MSQQKSIITQKISKTTKRIKSSVEAYLDPENPIKDMWRQSHQKHIDALSQKSSSRFSDYVILSKDYRQFGDIEQIVFHNKARCKELLFCAAATHWIVCQYFDPNGPMTFSHSWSEVNFRSKSFFEAAIIADANELACKLGKYLLTTERDIIPYDAWEAYRTTTLLYFGRDEEAIQACAAIRRNTKCKSMLLMADVYEALLEGDNQRFYDALIASMRLNRRDPNLIDWLDTWAISMGKIAVKRGFEVPIDTEDCPQCLIQPEQCDYSHIEIPAPIEGFPWEQGRQ